MTRFAAALRAVATTLVVGACVPAVPPAHAATQEFDAPGCSAFAVPTGFFGALGVLAVGAPGGGPFGGAGANASALIGGLAAGDALQVCVDAGGGPGGAGGRPGGGASSVARPGAAAPLVLAAGGGGGGMTWEELDDPARPGGPAGADLGSAGTPGAPSAFSGQGGGGGRQDGPGLGGAGALAGEEVAGDPGGDGSWWGSGNPVLGGAGAGFSVEFGGGPGGGGGAGWWGGGGGGSGGGIAVGGGGGGGGSSYCAGGIVCSATPGGTGPARVRLTFDVDLVAPVTTDDVPDGLQRNAVPVTLTGTDDRSGVAATYFTTGVSPPPPTTSSARYDPADKPVLGDGERIRYFSVDVAGNAEAPRTSPAARVAGPRPGPPVLLGFPEPETRSRTATFVVAGEPGAFLECALDGAPFAPCAETTTYGPLPLGRHEFRARQTSASADAGPTVTYRWRVDVNFLPGAAGSNASALRVLVGRPVAPRSGALPVGCALDRGSLSRCSVRVTTTGRGGTRTLLGTASASVSARGQLGVVVRVRLTAAGRRLVTARPGGLRVRVEATAAAHDGPARLTATTTTVVRPPQIVVLPSSPLFDGGSATLRPAARRYLRGLAAELAGAARLRCEGHTDDRIPPSRARALGLRRATAVCRALRAAGLRAPSSRASFGSTRPRATNTTAAGRRINRRVEVRVWF